MWGINYLTIVLSFILCGRIESLRVKDTLNERSNWEFLTRFCFLSRGSVTGKGKLEYTLKYPESYGVQKLLFYYDTPGQWEAVYKRDKSCQEKTDLGADNMFSLEPYFCDVEEINGVRNFVCRGSLDFTSARERWWYMVISRCGDAHDTQYNDRLYLEYDLHMTNGDDFLHQEYSADQFYIVIMDIIFFLFYCVLWVASIICANVLMKRQLYHTTYKMYMAAVTIWMLHLLCLVIAWVSYGVSGWEKSSLEVFGRILQATSNVIFMLMLILIAKGFTIVRGKLKTKAYIKITIFIAIYIVATITLFIWEAVIFDPGLVLYYYESPPGYGMIIVTLLGWLWFTKAAVFTLKHYKKKNTFYITLYIIYSIWFWAGPITILLAMFAMAKWTREKTVNGVQQFIGFCGHTIFFFLTMPSKVNSNFPYHVKTTQITVMGGEGEHPDAPDEYTNIDGTWTTTGPNLDFFTVAKAGHSDDSSTMYRPLESRLGEPSSSRTNDSPPPPYPQALGCQPVPPISTDTLSSNNIYSNGNLHNGSNMNNSTNNTYSNEAFEPTLEDQPHRRRNILPPLAAPLAARGDGESTATTLPPIRGSGLPPLIPSAPVESQRNGGEQEEDGVEGMPAPRNLSKMFRVSDQ